METFNEYQNHIASNFRKYPDAGKLTQTSLSYLLLKLNGEAGECAEKYGKLLRDENGVVGEYFRQALKLELGDVQWYISELASVLGFTLQDIANSNVEKLTSRRERGVLGGSGDNR